MHNAHYRRTKQVGPPLTWFGAPLLQTRRVRNELARRSFGVAVPAVWNALPLALRLAPSLDTFKAGLKSNLFREAFHDLLQFFFIGATMLNMSLSTVPTTRRCIAQETFCEFVLVINGTIIIII